jgi:trehalose 6-phosphate synthase
VSATPFVVASNRGPVSFERAKDGSVTERRGVGGLVTAVGGALGNRDALWIAAPMSDDDRARINEGAFAVETSGGKLRVRFADVPPDVYDLYYNEFSNRILWFLHHQLWEQTPRVFGDADRDAWDAYRTVNERFATAIEASAPPGAVALPQDYHLSLVPGLLKRARPDVPIAMFWHIPFARPEGFELLGNWGAQLLEGMLGADVVGFHTLWWASNFAGCCAAVLGAQADDDSVTYQGRTTLLGKYPIGVDADALRAEVTNPAVDVAAKRIEELTGDRMLVVRVDRTELSKNILRGLVAFGQVLERRPDLHEKVVHVVLLTPSRGDVPEYQEYTRACLARADRINARFGNRNWRPVTIEIDDDFSRTLAAYRRYDVLLVNPVFDGMNLVAREGPLLNERDGVLVLSANAGAADEIGTNALIINPFDTRDTAMALEHALDMQPTERAARAEHLRKVAAGDSPAVWLDRQLNDLERLRGA